MELDEKHRARRDISPSEYVAMLARLVRASGKHVADGTPDDYAALARLAGDLDSALEVAIAGLRDAGYTWQEIGAATGVTRQAALMKWGPKL